MLNRLVAKTQQALDAVDPATRASIIAQYIQPYARWALRWAIEDCRAGGMSWTRIAQVVDQPYTTVRRQMQEGGRNVARRAQGRLPLRWLGCNVG
jgi:hypothetical protein